MPFGNGYLIIPKSHYFFCCLLLFYLLLEVCILRNSFSSVSIPGEFSTPPGDPIHHICSGRFDGRTLKVVETGTEDIQQAIQAHAPFTDIRYMLSRLSVGDDSVFSSRQPMYGDFSGLFDNPIDAINAVNDARSRFDLLTADEKKACNNDWRVWFATLLNNSSVVDKPDSATDLPADPTPIVTIPSVDLPAKEVVKNEP